MRLLPFIGTRYSPSAGDVARLAAPPFDQIGPELRSRLHTEPLQFAHLTRPDPQAAGGPAAHAAALQRRWLADGSIARDPRPALYPYEILLAAGGRRLGVCGLVGLEPPEAGIVVPHEQTVERTVAERLELLRATRCDLEPILMLADDDGELDRELAPVCDATTPLAEHRDRDGNRHRLYRVDEPATLDRWQKLLAERRAIIADGHHRWQVARSYAAEVRPAAGSPAATKLTVLTSLTSPGVGIDPIHRGLAGALSPSAVAGVERTPWSGDGGRQLAAAVAAAPQPTVGWVGPGGRCELLHFDGGSELPAARAALAVCRLHDELLPRLGLAESSATDGSVAYRSDPDELWRELSAGGLATGFFLPPMSPTAFGAALAAGGLLPPKSTRFLPKLESGLVWAEHEIALG